MSAKLMGQVWDLDLPHNLQLVLLSLADHAQHDGTGVFPGVKLTAYKTGYSIRQVRRVLRQLEAAGLIVPTAREDGGRGHATEYELHFENGTRKPPYSGRKGDKMSPFSDPGEGQLGALKGDTTMSAFSDPDEGQASALKGDKTMSAFSDPGEGQASALKGDKTMSAFSDPDEGQASALKGDKTMSAFSDPDEGQASALKGDIFVPLYRNPDISDHKGGHFGSVWARKADISGPKGGHSYVPPTVPLPPRPLPGTINNTGTVSRTGGSERARARRPPHTAQIRRREALGERGVPRRDASAIPRAGRRR